MCVCLSPHTPLSWPMASLPVPRLHFSLVFCFFPGAAQVVLSLPIERRVLELCDAVPSLGDCRTAPLTAERARAAVEGSDEEAMKQLLSLLSSPLAVGLECSVQGVE